MNNKIVYARREFLNEPGMAGDSSISAEVVESQYGEAPATLSGTVRVRSCYKVAELTLNFDTDWDQEGSYENTLNKVYIMLDVLQELRDVIEANRERSAQLAEEWEEYRNRNKE